MVKKRIGISELCLFSADNYYIRNREIPEEKFEEIKSAVKTRARRTSLQIPYSPKLPLVLFTTLH